MNMPSLASIQMSVTDLLYTEDSIPSTTLPFNFWPISHTARLIAVPWACSRGDIIDRQLARRHIIARQRRIAAANLAPVIDDCLDIVQRVRESARGPVLKESAAVAGTSDLGYKLHCHFSHEKKVMPQSRAVRKERREEEAYLRFRTSRYRARWRWLGS